MCELKLLSKTDTLNLLQTLQQTYKATELLDVAKSAYTGTADLPLLREIRDIAVLAQDQNFVRELDSLISSSESAYESLKLAGVLLKEANPK